MWLRLYDHPLTEGLNVADVGALVALADYTLREDTGGLISDEVARALVPSGARRERLHRARLLHAPADVPECGCDARTAPGYWSLHPDVVTTAGV